LNILGDLDIMEFMINVCIFEDEGYEDLLPLTFARPAYDLLVGIDTIFDKIYRYFNYANITLHCRSYLKPFVKTKYPDLAVNKINTGSMCLFINGRVLMNDELMSDLSQIDEDHNYLFTHQGEIVAMLVSGKELDHLEAMFCSVPNKADLIQYLRPLSVSKEIKSLSIINNLWDLLSYNEETLVSDFRYFNQPGIIKGEIHPFSVIYKENNVFIDTGTVVEDFVVINAKNGPVYIEENVYIESGSRLEGPLFIGKNTKILGGKIKNSSIGPNCKVAGEINGSVFYQYSNKSHTGYIGNSYIGEWVNLGAQTTTSNLKNTYTEVKIDTGTQIINSGQLFLGSIIGDHVKTGINAVLNTGTIIGYGSNIFGTALHSKYIAPFTWGEKDNYCVYKLDKYLETAKRMMDRRNIELSKSDIEIVSYLYETIVNSNTEAEKTTVKSK
jgi:UDP-N-acetylglucosamine diphosphorylase / glucose-1-phosphate thymidylyltransferase / UDP-N-acetylgalactosamine diphosphorylase / glucosamine-1-phosphate N-acetyltransferase / galactosamine-1-phosphate N-acetyltransferase